VGLWIVVACVDVRALPHSTLAEAASSTFSDEEGSIGVEFWGGLWGRLNPTSRNSGDFKPLCGAFERLPLRHLSTKSPAKMVISTRHLARLSAVAGQSSALGAGCRGGFRNSRKRSPFPPVVDFSRSIAGMAHALSGGIG
jgi:hypothetical protein